ncbi:hypothetical protein BH10ACT1_BH10ACT1_05200 [soil metagenome]
MATRAVLWRWAGVSLAATAVAWLPVARSDAMGRQATCAPPHLPVWGEAQQQGPGSAATQVWPAGPAVRPVTTGTDLSYSAATAAAGVDMDGDGAADQITVDGTDLVITRGDGVVRIGTAGAGVSEPDLLPVGDLDADGHDELHFLAVPAGVGGASDYIVPGSTALGSHEVADVAVAVPDGIRYPVGPQVAGPGADLLATIGSLAGPLAIVSGEAVMAPGPGGTLPEFVPASDLLAGQAVDVLDLGGAAPTIATAVDTGDRSEMLLWQQGTTTRYATAGPSARLDLGGAFLRAVDTADGRVLVGGASGRGGATTFIWDLDDPCAAPLTPTTRPPAPLPTDPSAAVPATAVAGSPGYTG